MIDFWSFVTDFIEDYVVSDPFDRARVVTATKAQIIKAVTPDPIDRLVNLAEDVVDTKIDIASIAAVPVILGSIAGIPAWILVAFVVFTSVAVVSGDEDLIKIARTLGLVISLVSAAYVLYLLLVHSAYIAPITSAIGGSATLKAVLSGAGALALSVLGSVLTAVAIDELLGDDTELGELVSDAVGSAGFLAILASLLYLLASISRGDPAESVSNLDHLNNQLG